LAEFLRRENKRRADRGQSPREDTRDQRLKKRM